MPSWVLIIHLLDGTSNGIQTAQIDNWIGKVFVAPRPDLPALLQQPELSGLGVYILIGDDPNQFGRKIIYIGEGFVSSRLKLHSSSNDKAFWDNKTVVVVGDLNNSACLYLESRLIELAVKSGVAEVKNDQKPALPYMAAHDKATAENFLAQIQVLLPVLNIDYFVQPPAVTPAPGNSSTTKKPSVFVVPASPRFVFATQNVTAEAEQISSKFVVLKGSVVSPNEAASIGKSNSTLRSQLRANEKLVDDTLSGKWVFSDDVAFNSPSAAAAVICGLSIAGPAVWKVKGGTQTYGEWLQSQVDVASSVSVTK